MKALLIAFCLLAQAAWGQEKLADLTWKDGGETEIQLFREGSSRRLVVTKEQAVEVVLTPAQVQEYLQDYDKTTVELKKLKLFHEYEGPKLKGDGWVISFESAWRKHELWVLMRFKNLKSGDKGKVAVPCVWPADDSDAEALSIIQDNFRRFRELIGP